MGPIRRVVLFFFVTALCTCSLVGFGQAPEPRLKEALAGTARAALVGSRSPRTLPAQDMGAVTPGMAVPGITLVFKRSAVQEQALQALLAAQQNRLSPLYHQWLTPDGFAARFGMADADIDAAEKWLESYGFHVDGVARSRDRITFSGNAGQVEAAFGTDLHYYNAEGELHFAPAADLTLPEELASATAAVLHLSDFRPKPNVKVQTRSPHANLTSLPGQYHYLSPKDIFTMYDVNPYADPFSPITGSGQGLAIVGQSFVSISDDSAVEDFRAPFGSSSSINTVLVPGSGVEAISSGDEGESEIDLEYASTVASGANIFLVFVGDNQNYDVFDALAFAIHQNIAPVISISYGNCEAVMSATDMDQGNALFEEAAAQGQTLVASAGDAGSTQCANWQGITTAQQQALSVSYPADSPYVTAVGGTQMAAGTFAAGSSQYWASATTNVLTSSLLSYVPEVVWNEDTTLGYLVAGGGGASAHFSRPAWQSGVPGISAGAYRLLPDIALQSSIESPGFVLCSDDAALIYPQTYSCDDGLEGNDGEYTVTGGTSFAAPIFAGFVAMLNQVEHTNGQGNINPILYGLASNPTTYAGAFHDITSGTNACPAGSADCSAVGSSSYAATVGYDEATGLGSVDFGQLAAAWPASSESNLVGTATVLSGLETASPGDNLPIQISVGSMYSPGGSTAPTGTVSVSVDGSVVQPSLAFSATNSSESSASVNYNFVAPTTAGSHLVTATYSGDATHSPSAATYSVLVGTVTAAGKFSLSSSNLKVPNGNTASEQITITPTGGYSGRVVWSLSASGTGADVSSCYSIGSTPVNGISTATIQIGAGSACNSAAPAVRNQLRPMVVRASLKGESQRPGSSVPGIAVAGLLCGLLAGWRRRNRLPLLLSVAVLTLAGLGLGLSGCGGASGGSTTSNQTLYTVTLTGTDSINTSITASTTFLLTVN